MKALSPLRAAAAQAQTYNHPSDHGLLHQLPISKYLSSRSSFSSRFGVSSDLQHPLATVNQTSLIVPESEIFTNVELVA